MSGRPQPLAVADRVKLPKLAPCLCGACLYGELFFVADPEAAVLTERCGDVLIYRLAALEYAPTAEQLEALKRAIREDPARAIVVEGGARQTSQGIRVISTAALGRQGGPQG